MDCWLFTFAASVGLLRCGNCSALGIFDWGVWVFYPQAFKFGLFFAIGLEGGLTSDRVLADTSARTIFRLNSSR